MMFHWKSALVTAIAALAMAQAASAAAFDHTHAAWSALLAKHIVLISDGNAGQVRYAAFAQRSSGAQCLPPGLGAQLEHDWTLNDVRP